MVGHKLVSTLGKVFLQAGTPRNKIVFQRFATDNGRKSLETIGFIGLGNMGSKMSVNLIKNGYKVAVNDINQAACKVVAAEGAEIMGNAQDLVGEVDCIVTMLPDSNSVLNLYKKGSGVIERIKPGTLVIDCSTVDPSTAVQLAPQFKQIGVDFIDAPVSGGVVAAQQSTLTFMVGGEAKDFEKATPVLKAMGKNVVHCGPAGSGLIAKICNNLLLGISMVGVCEAMNIGIKLGLEPSVLTKVINTSSGRCWSSDTYNPVPGVQQGVPSGNEYKPGFSVKLITKDLTIAKRAAESAGIPFEMGEKTLSLYQQLSQSEFGDSDFSVVYKYLKEKTK